MKPIGVLMLGFQSLVVAIVVYFSAVAFPNHPLIVTILSTTAFVVVHTKTNLGSRFRSSIGNMCASCSGLSAAPVA
jgi:hypothetical protein